MRIVTWCLVVPIFVQFESRFAFKDDDGTTWDPEIPSNFPDPPTLWDEPHLSIFNGTCDFSNCSNSTINYSNRDSRPCECDKDCIEFRDCCPDSEYYNREEQQKSMDFECHQIGNFAYFLKRSCPSSWDDLEITNKCASSLKHNLDTEDIELRSPVTSTATNITYGNIYCAFCNNELDDVVFWNVSIWNCDPVSEDGGSNDSNVNLSSKEMVISLVKSNETESETDVLIPTLSPTPIELNFTSLKFDGKSWFYEDAETRYDCSLILEPPTSLQLYYCPSDYTPMIRDCPINWTDASIADQCRSIHSRVYNWHGTPYRNKYCAYCNGLNDENLTCDSIEMYSALPPVYTSDETTVFGRKQQFTILFDFKLKVDSKICNDTKKSHQHIQKKLCPRRPLHDLNTHEPESTEHEVAGHEVLFHSILSIYAFIAVLISLIFLLLHLTIFFVVQELQTIGGKNLASFCIALILAYSSFIFGSFAENEVCYGTAVLMYYSFLCAFFWMLIISYDMWNTFWNATKRFRSPRNVRKTFIIYSILVWSLPLILVGTALYFDLTDSKSVLAPHFGYNGCWFDNGFSLLLFFVGPVCAILIVNFALFLHTWYLLHSSRCESVNQKSRVDFKLFTRIGLLTGFTWITGFVAGYTQILILWFIFVILNTAQGVFIFSAFSCKKRVIRCFLKRINKFERLQRNLEETNAAFSCTTSTPLNDNVTRNS